MAKKSGKKVTVREFVSIQHNYTQDERNELTRLLTSAVQEKSEQSERLKSVSADFKARIKTAESQISEATNKICNGYEMRQVEANVEMDRESGVKKVYFHAPGKKEHKKLIREDQMSESDYAKLPLEDAPPEKPKSDKKSKAKKTEAAAPAETNPAEAENTSGNPPEA